ncbi:MAG: hypothetical protein OQK12_03505 [Motiliproteus sp.]|nr:hypothetical protein [Motiliproteus sp.]MCW9053388.1 hypothetical protein [Motiliproteus sp.]
MPEAYSNIFQSVTDKDALTELLRQRSLSLDEFGNRLAEIGFPKDKIDHLVQLLLNRPKLSIAGIIDMLMSKYAGKERDLSLPLLDVYVDLTEEELLEDLKNLED